MSVEGPFQPIPNPSVTLHRFPPAQHFTWMCLPGAPSLDPLPGLRSAPSAPLGKAGLVAEAQGQGGCRPAGGFLPMEPSTGAAQPAPALGPFCA